MNRTLAPALALQKQLVFLAGNFAPAGTGAPTGVTGAGVTVTRVSAGLFKLTLSQPVAAVVSVDAQLALATPAALSCQLGTITKNASNRYEVQVLVLSGATPTDVAAVAGNAIHWAITAAQSSVAAV